MSLRVGIAGFGVVGKKRKECANRNPNLSVIAVCDADSNKLIDLDSNVLGFDSYDKLLKLDLDLVFVCLTNDLAAKVTSEALNSGCHVFCEKPPGRSVDDILGVIGIEKLYPKLKLMYGFNHRHHHSIRDALEIVSSGKLGRIVNLRGVYGKSQLITFNQSDWRTRREIAGGGVLLDQGIHLVDLMRLFCGEFEVVSSVISNDYWGFDVEDNAYAIMRSQQGVIAMLHSSATQWPHKFSLEINLEHGSLVLSGILSSSKSYGREILTIYEKNEHFPQSTNQKTIEYDEDPSWQNEVDIFTQHILNDTIISSGSSKEALSTMLLISNIYSSDKEWNKKFSFLI